MKVRTQERLSESLTRLIAEEDLRFTLNELLHRTEGRGLYLVMILLCLPFISPIPVPGLSNVFGVVISLLAFQLASNRGPRLPAVFGERKISRKTIERVIQTTSRMSAFLERLARPRYSKLFSCRSIQFTNAAALLFMGVLLALPLPPLIPFSNSLPSWSIILIALAALQKDGLLVWVGYAVGLVTFLYLAFLSGALLLGLEKLIHW